MSTVVRLREEFLPLPQSIREPAPPPAGGRLLRESQPAAPSLEDSFRRIFQNESNCDRLAEAAARGRGGIG